MHLFEAVLVGLRHLGVEDEELEMRHADPVHAIVLDVLGPRAALDVQQLSQGRVLELHGDQGRLVVLLNRILDCRRGTIRWSIWWDSRLLVWVGLA